jgi:hypothetical protein
MPDTRCRQSVRSTTTFDGTPSSDHRSSVGLSPLMPQPLDQIWVCVGRTNNSRRAIEARCGTSLDGIGGSTTGAGLVMTMFDGGNSASGEHVMR